MKQFLYALVLVGSVTLLTGCGCYSGGCGYVQTSYVPSCGGGCGCSSCGYGFGYNDWY